MLPSKKKKQQRVAVSLPYIGGERRVCVTWKTVHNQFNGEIINTITLLKQTLTEFDVPFDLLRHNSQSVTKHRTTITDFFDLLKMCLTVADFIAKTIENEKKYELLSLLRKTLTNVCTCIGAVHKILSTYNHTTLLAGVMKAKK